jgi:hypothetical protein
MSYSRLPRTGVRVEELTLDEVLGLQGWTMRDLDDNRAGRLSAAQQERLGKGVPELFGLVHVHLIPVAQLAPGKVASCEGVCRSFEGPNLNGRSLKLTVDDRTFFWADAENYDGSAAFPMRIALLDAWARGARRVRVYFVGEDNLVSLEPG